METLNGLLDTLQFLFSMVFLGIVGTGIFIAGGWITIWIVVVKRRKHAKQT